MKIEEFDWEKIIEPNWRKLIAFFVFLFSISVGGAIIWGTMRDPGFLKAWSTTPAELYRAIFNPSSELIYEPLFSPFFGDYTSRSINTIRSIIGSIFSIIDLFYKYVLACLILWVYDTKVKK